MPEVTYILTEDNLIHGHKGKLINYQQYKDTAYYDRALYEYCEEEDYEYKVEASHRDQEPVIYMAKDYHALCNLLKHFDLYAFAIDIKLCLSRTKAPYWKLQTPLKTYKITKP